MTNSIIFKSSLAALFFMGIGFSNAQIREGGKSPKRLTEQKLDPNGVEKCGTVEYEAHLQRKFPERLTTE